MAISSTDGTHVLLDNDYYRTVANGNFNIGNVKLDLHHVQMEINGRNDHATLITVKSEIVATAGITADLVPMPPDTDTPTTTKIHKLATIQLAPTKSQTRAIQPIIVQSGARMVLHR
jgi:hypothetical protein